MFQLDLGLKAVFNFILSIFRNIIFKSWKESSSPFPLILQSHTYPLATCLQNPELNFLGLLPPTIFLWFSREKNCFQTKLRFHLVSRRFVLLAKWNFAFLIFVHLFCMLCPHVLKYWWLTPNPTPKVKQF